MKKIHTLTTGEIAKYCGVNFRTVIRWIDKGHIKAFKLPGRGNNRVLASDFISFLKQHAIPIPPELQGLSQRILIVEDDKAMSRSIQRTLRNSGFETLVAQNGFEAGNALQSFVPQIMTLDLSMPGMDGFEVIEYVRKEPLFCRLKILVISASPNIEDALDAGADDVLTKPFKSKTLTSKINTLLNIDS